MSTQVIDDEQAQVRDAILAEIRKLPDERKAAVMGVANRMRELAWNNGADGQFALALVGAEMAMGR